MLNAIGNLFASPPRPRTSRRRVLGLLTAQHLETRLALTGSALAPTALSPTVVGPVQAPVVPEQTVAEATEEHSYPVDEGVAEYSDSEPVLMGAPATLVLSLDDSGETSESEIEAQEVQFPDTNQVADNTAFFESVQSPQQALVADGEGPVQNPLPLESAGRAGLESSPSLSPIALIAEEEEAPKEDGDEGELESDKIDGEDPPAEAESAAVTEERPLVDEAVMALDMDTNMPKEDAESSKTEPMAKPSATSDVSQTETAGDGPIQQTSASATVDAEDAATIEVSDLDEFFSSEQSTVAPHQKAVATAAIGLLGVAQMRRSRRQSELVGDQGL